MTVAEHACRFEYRSPNTNPIAANAARSAPTVFLLYDADAPGQKASFRAADVLLARGLTVRMVTLPDGEDPDTFVASHGGAALEQQLGQALDVSLFADGDLVDVVGVSKGKGFAGTIKRHSFARGPETHGADHHREPGSIGAGTTPGRVYRGTRMAGHMGVERVTVLKMKIVRSDGERNLLLIKGSVPGAKNALVAVSKAEQI